MGQAQKQQKKKKAEAQNRNKVKCTRYRSQMRRERNKLRRILKSSGATATKKWAEANAESGAMNALKQIARQPGKIGRLAKEASAGW